MGQDQYRPSYQDDTARNVESSAQQLGDEAKHVGGTVKDEAAGIASTVKNEASSIVGTVKDEASGVIGTVKDEASSIAGTVKSEASGLVGTVRDEAMRQVEGGREKVAERLSSLADTMRDSSGELRQREAWLADLMDKGAQELGNLATTLQKRDLSGLIAGVEDFARRQPALYAGAAVALGFAAARLAKSTASRPSHEPPRQTYSPAQGPSPSHASIYPEAPGASAPSSPQSSGWLAPEQEREAPVMGGGFAPSAAGSTPARGEPL